MSETRPAPGTPAFWDARFSGDEPAYGKEPNVFLTQMAPRLPKGRAFVPADGQGRNGLWLAEQGWDVTSVDLSPVAVNRVAADAARRNLSLSATVGDLVVDAPARDAFDVVAVFYFHIPKAERNVAHSHFVRALAPGGMLVIEGFSPAFVDLPPEGRSHGPISKPIVMFSPDDLREEFAGLQPIICEEADVILAEGCFHRGRAIVTRGLFQRAA